MINWNDATMATGVADIDAQHRELVARINALVEAMSQGKGRQELKPLLDYLSDYAGMHFGHEEACMERHRCPAAKANKEAHEQFVQTFTGLKQRIETEGAGIALVIEVQQKLCDWLVNHIIKTDRQLGPCVKKA